jgi:hypothetical protein
MDAIVNPRKRCGVASACRRIRGRWDREERRQRQRIAEVKQQELWRLLEATWSLSAKEGVGRPALASGSRIVRPLRSTGVFGFPS